MKWASAVSDRQTLEEAVDECVSSIRDQDWEGPPDLAVIFLSAHFAAQYGIPIVGGRLNGYQPSVFRLLNELGATIVDIGTQGEDTSLAIALAEALGHDVPEEPTLAEPDATTLALARIMQILGSTGGRDEIDVERLLGELRLQLTQKAKPRDN